MFLWTWSRCLLCIFTADVAASNITVVDAITCEGVTALPGNTVASVLQAVTASDCTLCRQKVSQRDAENPAAAALVMPSADAHLTPAMPHQIHCMWLSQAALARYTSWSASTISWTCFMCVSLQQLPTGSWAHLGAATHGASCPAPCFFTVSTPFSHFCRICFTLISHCCHTFFHTYFNSNFTLVVHNNHTVCPTPL